MLRKIAVLCAALVTMTLAGCGYNDLQRQDEGIKAAWSEVLNQYQRRADLVPNLVNTVKGYAQHAVARLLRKIGAGVKRHEIVRSEKYGQRPAAAALRQCLMRELIDLVEIRPFLAIDLDVDEQLVHQFRGRRVFE